MTPLKVEVVTNETVLELFKFMNANNCTCTFITLTQEVASPDAESNDGSISYS